MLFVRNPDWWNKASYAIKRDVVGILNGKRSNGAAFGQRRWAIGATSATETSPTFRGIRVQRLLKGGGTEVRLATLADVYLAVTHPELAPAMTDQDRHRLKMRLGKERLAAITEQLRKEEEDRQGIQARLLQVEKWRTGQEPLPSDIRRCKNRKLRRKDYVHYFLTSPNRRKQFCDDKCRGRYRTRKSDTSKAETERAPKLQRVRKAMKLYRGLPDWKDRAARRAGVTKNFITYAIRRKELRK